MRIRINADIVLTDSQARFFEERFGDRAVRKASEWILQYGMGVVEELGNAPGEEQQEGREREADNGGPGEGGVFGHGTG
jgi:hypothetical protein